MNPAQHILLALVRFYRMVISPALGAFFGPAGGCRFTPTCSVYAADAVRNHGAVHGSWLATKRLCRCHPWGGCGHDPVPEKKFSITESKGLGENIIWRIVLVVVLVLVLDFVLCSRTRTTTRTIVLHAALQTHVKAQPLAASSSTVI